MMWVLVVNGLVYLGFVYLHGEWRDLVPRRGLFHFCMPIIGAAAVVSGLAIWAGV